MVRMTRLIQAVSQSGKFPKKHQAELLKRSASVTCIKLEGNLLFIALEIPARTFRKAHPIVVWSMEEHAEVSVYEGFWRDYTTAMDVDPYCRFLITSCSDGSLFMWEIATGAKIMEQVGTWYGYPIPWTHLDWVDKKLFGLQRSQDGSIRPKAPKVQENDADEILPTDDKDEDEDDELRGRRRGERGRAPSRQSLRQGGSQGDPTRKRGARRRKDRVEGPWPGRR